MDLSSYMERGVASIEKRTAAFYISNPNGRRFLAKFLPALHRSASRRKAQERRGVHVPQFLICSITSRCNLHCKGCYARAGGICSDKAAAQMSADEWKKVFAEAEGLGISFILLAGGEPLLRRDVLEAAASVPEIAFPVFTNGTLLTEEFIAFFDVHRNLIPVLSIEGDAAATDARRGEGVSEQITATMQRLRDRGILFAASTTVTAENLDSVVTDVYLESLRRAGCGIAFYIEYVPAEHGTEGLVLSPEQADDLNKRADALREQFADMSVFSFPGDEAYTDGCLAAGRGFFHINPAGGAEPCPFSPFSKLNVRDNTLLEVLASEYFKQVRAISAGDTVHDGGCTLFRHEAEIRAL